MEILHYSTFITLLEVTAKHIGDAQLRVINSCLAYRLNNVGTEMQSKMLIE